MGQAKQRLEGMWGNQNHPVCENTAQGGPQIGVWFAKKEMLT